ncbi:hypothetical protein NLG97_g2483 [Lecanicillium saksenae]|uniref:Uncharacterized protein n=1 Tax=Lecanicillium saksenae TaxID=468837 RepID=A0ACC1R0S2_9HYPO|nr:hypothetical protein NLG97_g2483 [Lecanicillium saksenae]
MYPLTPTSCINIADLCVADGWRVGGYLFTGLAVGGMSYGVAVTYLGRNRAIKALAATSRQQATVSASNDDQALAQGDVSQPESLSPTIRLRAAGPEVAQFGVNVHNQNYNCSMSNLGFSTENGVEILPHKVSSWAIV